MSFYFSFNGHFCTLELACFFLLYFVSPHVLLSSVFCASCCRTISSSFLNEFPFTSVYTMLDLMKTKTKTPFLHATQKTAITGQKQNPLRSYNLIYDNFLLSFFFPFFVSSAISFSYTLYYACTWSIAFLGSIRRPFLISAQLFFPLHLSSAFVAFSPSSCRLHVPYIVFAFIACYSFQLLLLLLLLLQLYIPYA